MSPEFGVKFGSSLTHLNLSESGFSGNIPHEISHLSNIVSLDLSSTHYPGLKVESDRVVERIGHNLTQLRVLSLDGLDMSSVHASSLMNLSTSLNSLNLRECRFQGQFPASFLLRPNLQELDLSYSNFNSITSLPDFNSTTTPSNNLRVLFLSHADLSTSIGFLDFVGNHLTSLRRLYLNNCNISGSIPITFSNLTHMSVLDMGRNELDGPFPSYLFALPSLEYIDLSSNNLHGHFPTPPIKSVNLTYLDLSNNNFSDSLDFDVFLTFRELSHLDLSKNNISSIYTNLTCSLPSFQLLNLSGCKLNQFPTFLKALTNLTYLDVSNNQIQGPIPEWIYDVGKDTLSYIDLSGNLLTSVGHPFHWNNIQLIDFHSNLLQGPLPIPPTTTLFFSVSNNNLSGEIFSLICNLIELQSLDLSHNQFTGSIPQCLGSLGNLSALNLGMNSLNGLIPNTFANHSSLNSLVLKGNQLTGTIPQTLSYCQYLQILDVGNNMIEDTFPHWLETLSSLEVLVLQSNKFYGSLNSHKDKFLFPVLKILDLSNNNFTGGVPIKLITSLDAMAKVDKKLEDGRQYMKPPNPLYSNLYYSMVITVKGLKMEYVKILTTLATIDLSRNKFEGHIPEVIGMLISLNGLNLSHNLLTGHIPSSLGGLGSLEWLDLSHNKLSGQIPRELTYLNFLGVLDLSSNQLDGTIPQGRHFDTFGNDSYKDNLALCGFPLTKACGPNHDPTSHTSEDRSSSDSFNWKGVFAGYGCGIVFGLSVGYLVFKTRSPKWFVKMVEGKQRGKVGKRSERRARARN